MTKRLDQLAEALGKARAAHEKRPDDRLAELRFEAARAAFLDEQLREKDRELRAALGQLATLRRELRDLRQGIKARIAAVFAQPRRKAKRKAADCGTPLLERAA